jgi:hypothetical protein
MTRRRKLEVALSMQPQQQPAAHDVFEYAVGLPPVPDLADPLRNRPATERGLLGEELPQER